MPITVIFIGNNANERNVQVPNPKATYRSSRRVPRRNKAGSFIRPFTSVRRRARAAICHFPSASSTTVVGNGGTRAPYHVSNGALSDRVNRSIASIVGVKHFTREQVHPARVVVIASGRSQPSFSIPRRTIRTRHSVRSSFHVLMRGTHLNASGGPIYLNVTGPIMIVPILPTPIQVSTVRDYLINLCRVFVFPARTCPTREPMAVVRRFQPRGILSVKEPSRAIFLVCSIPKGFLCANVMSNFRGQISVIRGMDTTDRGLLSCLRVAIRELVSRQTRPIRVIEGGFHALNGKSTSEAMAAFVSNVAKDLIARRVSPSHLHLNGLRRICCVTVVDSQGQFPCLRDLLHRARYFYFVFDRVLGPALQVTNLSTKAIRFYGSANDANCGNHFQLYPARSSRAKKSGRVPTRVLVLQGTWFLPPNVRWNVRHPIRGPLQASVRPTTNNRLSMVDSARLNNCVPIFLVIRRTSRRKVNGGRAKYVQLKARRSRQVSKLSRRYLLTHRCFRVLLSRTVLRPILTGLPNFTVHSRFM